MVEWWYRDELVPLLVEDDHPRQLRPNLPDDVVAATGEPGFYEALDDVEEGEVYPGA